MSAFATATRSILGWVSAAVAVAVIAVSASILAAPGKAYADTASHIEATGEIHVLVDGAGSAAIPNVTLRNTGSVAAYVTGCSAPDELSGWTCDAVGKRIEPGQSVQASWSGQVSADTAAKLGSEAYFAGTLTYSYVDAVLKGTVTIDNQDPCVGDTVTASVSGLNVPEDKVTYQWYRVKDGVETAIDGAVQPAYTVADADAGCTLLCKLLSSDSICIGSVSSDATHEVKRLEAFAVYSADDGSLNFYKRSSVPAAGEAFNGKTATAVYTGIETETYRSDMSVPWSQYRGVVKTVTVADEGIAPVSTAMWFYHMSHLESADISKLDTRNVTDMNGMFSYCSSLTTLDLSFFDTSKVTDMSQMFCFCYKLTSLDLSSFDTSNVTDMRSMLYACGSLTALDLSSFDTRNVTDLSGMFWSCSKLQEVTFGENWKWVGANGYLPVPSDSYITGADSKWYDTDGNGYAPADVPSNKAMTYYASKDLLPKAFAVYSDDDQSLNFYKRSSVPAAGEAFNGKTATVVDAGLQPCNMDRWFYGCQIMTVCNLDKLDTSSLTNASYMFSGCSSLTSVGDLSGWVTSKVTKMYGMFDSCSKLTSVGDLSGWVTSSLADASYMFSGCSSLTSVGDLSNWDTSNVTKMSYMFFRCSALTSIGSLSNWNTGKVTKMSHMFYGCNSLTTLDLSNWNTGNVTDMGSMFTMFYDLSSALTSVGDLSNWDTSNVTSMNGMFYNCSNLTTIGDLSSWNTGKVTNMSYMFTYCSKLSADCSNWDVSKVNNHSNFNKNATGVTVPLAWQASSDEGGEDPTIAPLCEEQGNGDALSVSDENGNDEAASKTDGEASADSETEGSNTASADDAGAKGEEASGDVANDDVATV